MTTVRTRALVLTCRSGCFLSKSGFPNFAAQLLYARLARECGIRTPNHTQRVYIKLVYSPSSSLCCRDCRDSDCYSVRIRIHKWCYTAIATIAVVYCRASESTGMFFRLSVGILCDGLRIDLRRVLEVAKEMSETETASGEPNVICTSFEQVLEGIHRCRDVELIRSRYYDEAITWVPRKGGSPGVRRRCQCQETLAREHCRPACVGL